MNRYLAIANTWWQRAFNYRAVVFVYRISDLIEMGMLLILWTALYRTTPVIQGMTEHEMITYVLVGGLFYEITRNFSGDEVDRAISSGSLSSFLVKPMSYFRYYLSMSFGRSMHTALALITRLIILLILHSYLTTSVTLSGVCIIIAMLFLGYLTELFMNYLVGMTAFWTEETAPFYNTYRNLQKFFAGGYFPLVLLPAGLITASYWMPFAYRYFVPMQVFLGKTDVFTGIRGIAIQIVWLFILYGIIQIVWRRGLKKFEAVGR